MMLEYSATRDILRNRRNKSRRVRFRSNPKLEAKIKKEALWFLVAPREFFPPSEPQEKPTVEKGLGNALSASGSWPQIVWWTYEYFRRYQVAGYGTTLTYVIERDDGKFEVGTDRFPAS